MFKKRYKVLDRQPEGKVKRLSRHPFIVPVTTFLSLFFISAVLFVVLGSRSVVGPSDAHTVIVSYDKKQQTVPTRAANVGELLERLNITIEDGDIVEPDTTTLIQEDNFRINVYRARPITVIDGDRKIKAFTAAATLRTAAEKAGVTIHPEDEINREPVDNVLKEGIGEKLVINRAVPVNLNVYGTQILVRTKTKKVSDLLEEKNIKLAESDTLKPSLDTEVTPNMEIFVLRNGVEIRTIEEAIAMPSETVEDASLSFGTVVTRQKGAPGKKLVTYQVDIKDGQEVGRAIIQEVIVQPPVKEVTARGKAISIPSDKTAWMAQAGIAPSDYAYANYIISRESGWCPTKWQGQVGYCPAFYEERYSPSSSRGYGLCQSTPAIKMSSAGGDWATNPITQLRWCSGYAKSRHGGWAGAYNFWLANHYW